MEFGTLAHVLGALAVSGASLLLAIWTFSSGNRTPFEHTPVHAGDSTGQPSNRRVLSRTGTLPVQSAREVSRAGSDEIGEEAAQKAEPIALRGRIVDAFRRPIPFATLWLDQGQWTRWVEVDAKGTFDANLPEHIAEEWRAQGGSLRLAARAPRHAPSQVLSMDSVPEEELCFVLEQGAARLRLEVMDPAGRPLQGVQVSLTPAPGNPRLASARSVEQEWMPTPQMRTDSWGLLRMDGLAPGHHELRIEKAGYSPRLGRLHLIKGEICSRVIELRRSAQVHGVLVRSDGGPTGLAIVRATSAVTLQSFTVYADEEGRFALDDLPAGAIQLIAQSRSGPTDLFEAHIERSLSPGQDEVWNPVLRPVQLVRGQLHDSSGNPLAGWRVEVRERDAQDRKPDCTETDENGCYEVPAPRLSDLPMLAFFHPDAGRGIPTRVEPMVLRDDEVEDLVLEPEEETVARIVGRVLTPSGQPAVGVSLLLRRDADSLDLALTIDSSGYFSSPPVPPGLYVPVFPEHGLGWTPDEILRVEGNESVDVGTISLPELGRLSLMTSSSVRYTQKFAMTLDLLRPGIDPDYRLPVFQGILEVPLEIALAPGSYELGFPGEGVPCINFEIESGGNTMAELTPPK